MAKSEHNSLSAATVATVTIDSGSYDVLLVTNRTGTNPIYFTVGGATPAVAGDDTFVVPAVAGAAKGVELGGAGVPVVKLISAGAEDYSVEVR